jgi:hypothetical protein
LNIAKKLHSAITDNWASNCACPLALKSKRYYLAATALAAKAKKADAAFFVREGCAKIRKASHTRVRLEIPTAICGRTDETSITDSSLW